MLIGLFSLISQGISVCFILRPHPFTNNIFCPAMSHDNAISAEELIFLCDFDWHPFSLYSHVFFINSFEPINDFLAVKVADDFLLVAGHVFNPSCLAERFVPCL